MRSATGALPGHAEGACSVSQDHIAGFKGGKRRKGMGREGRGGRKGEGGDYRSGKEGCNEKYSPVLGNKHACKVIFFFVLYHFFFTD